MYDFSVIRELRKREGYRISDVAVQSGVSASVISKLERNASQPGLDTLDRISRVFGMNPSDFLSLAESRTPQKIDETEHHREGFYFREINYGNLKCLLGEAPKGARVSRPEIHADDYEVCWVLKGRLLFSLPEEQHEIAAGGAIQFDAVLEHVYEALESVRFLLTHVRKRI